MDIRILIDFGSTYTKVLAVDLAREVLIGRAQALTTIETDISIGLAEAYATLIKDYGIDERDVRGRYASSSAAGGLRMAAIGLVPSLTLEAARRAALGAGAKVVSAYGFKIDSGIVRNLEASSCDIILLTGGTDGGDTEVIVHNARMLANSALKCPILVAGNRVASEQVQTILEEQGKSVFITQNVLPRIDSVEVEPAQALIRDIFIRQITDAKGLGKAREFIQGEIVPTPKATLQAAALLADGANKERGIGSLVVVEVGGATTNIHSVCAGMPSDAQTIVRGLPESRIKRTVEGDLGIRYNAPTIYELMGDEQSQVRLRAIRGQPDAGSFDLKEHAAALSSNVGYVPMTALESDVDILFAEYATSIAMQRHAGTLREEYTPVGKIRVQNGKNLLDVENLIGTGGIFKYGRQPERVLRAARFSLDSPWSLKPQAARAFLDYEYILYGIGLLAEHFPIKALRIAKKYMRPVSIDSVGT